MVRYTHSVGSHLDITCVHALHREIPCAIVLVDPPANLLVLSVQDPSNGAKTVSNTALAFFLPFVTRSTLIEIALWFEYIDLGRGMAIQ